MIIYLNGMLIKQLENRLIINTFQFAVAVNSERGGGREGVRERERERERE